MSLRISLKWGSIIWLVRSATIYWLLFCQKIDGFIRLNDYIRSFWIRLYIDSNGVDCIGHYVWRLLWRIEVSIVLNLTPRMLHSLHLKCKTGHFILQNLHVIFCVIVNHNPFCNIYKGYIHVHVYAEYSSVWKISASLITFEQGGIFIVPLGLGVCFIPRITPFRCFLRQRNVMKTYPTCNTDPNGIEFYRVFKPGYYQHM